MSSTYVFFMYYSYWVNILIFKSISHSGSYVIIINHKCWLLLYFQHTIYNGSGCHWPSTSVRLRSPANANITSINYDICHIYSRISQKIVHFSKISWTYWTAITIANVWQSDLNGTDWLIYTSIKNLTNTTTSIFKWIHLEINENINISLNKNPSGSFSSEYHPNHCVEHRTHHWIYRKTISLRTGPPRSFPSGKIVHFSMKRIPKILIQTSTPDI